MVERSLIHKGQEREASPVRSAIEALIVIVFFIISVLIVAALALATPILLALSAVVGLLTNEKHDKGWRAAGA